MAPTKTEPTAPPAASHAPHHDDGVVSDLVRWFSVNARDLPWRRTRDPYAIWVSEVMLQQTQVKTVIPYWERWMRALPDLAALAGVSETKLHKLWEGLGYYSRARNLQRAAGVIQERHGGVFPLEYDAVLELPGIGPYTAGAICSIAFDQARPILDGNVIRVLSRLFAVEGNVRERDTNRRLWTISTRLVGRCGDRGPSPSAGAPSPSRLNQALMELGALVCTPRQPRCPECPVAGRCSARRQQRQETLPNLGPRPTITRRRFAAFLIRGGDQFLVRQRPAGGINSRLWEFPNLELQDPGDDARQAAQRLFGPVPVDLTPAGSVQHTITRYRITVEVYRAGLSAPSPHPLPHLAGEWLTPRQMANLPFTAAHKRILRGLAKTGGTGAMRDFPLSNGRTASPADSRRRRTPPARRAAARPSRTRGRS